MATRWTGPRRGRRLVRAAALTAALLTTSGCWLQVGANGGHTRENPDETTLTPATVAGLHEVWSAPVGNGPTEPMVKGGRVLVGTTSSSRTAVTAHDLGTGDQLWSTTLFDTGGASGSLVFGAPVTFLDDALRGAFAAGSESSPQGPVCRSGSVVLDPATGASTASSGAMTWARAANGDVRATIESACPDISSFVLRVTAPATSWRTASLGLITTAPTVSGRQVFLSRGTTLEAYAAAGCGAATCTPAWTLPFPNGLGPVIAGASGALFATSGSELVAIDRQGFVLWRAPLAGPASLAMANAGTVYAIVRSTSGPPQLAAFDAPGCGQAQCTPLWTSLLPGTGGGAPAVAGGVVYTSTSAGVQAFDAAGCGAPLCPALTTVATGPVGNMVVSDGHVLLTGNGQLTALGLG
jgi:outer membrane protein assembly factor BamB